MAKQPDKNSKKPSSNNPNAPDADHGVHEVTEHLQAIGNRDIFQDAMLNFWEFVERHQKTVAGIAVGCLVLAIAAVGWDFLKERQEKKAQESYYAIEKQYLAKKEQFDRAKFAPKEVSKESTPAAPATGDLSKDYGNVVDQLEGFATEHKGTTAGTQAALSATEIRLSYNQTEQAIKTIEAAAKATKASSLVGALARMASGNAYAAANQCDQAVQTWQQVMNEKTFAFLHGEAALRSGLCLEKSGQKDRAIEMYRKASAESEKSSAAQTARSLLRALEIGT